MEKTYKIDADNDFLMLDEIEFWNDYWKVENSKKKLELEELRYKKNIFERLIAKIRNENTTHKTR